MRKKIIFFFTPTDKKSPLNIEKYILTIQSYEEIILEESQEDFETDLARHDVVAIEIFCTAFGSKNVPGIEDGLVQPNIYPAVPPYQIHFILGAILQSHSFRFFREIIFTKIFVKLISRKNQKSQEYNNSFLRY